MPSVLFIYWTHKKWSSIAILFLRFRNFFFHFVYCVSILWMNIGILFFFQVLSQSTINDLVDIRTQAVQIAGARIQKHANRQFVKNDRMNGKLKKEMLTYPKATVERHIKKNHNERKYMDPKQQQRIKSLKQRYY